MRTVGRAVALAVALVLVASGCDSRDAGPRAGNAAPATSAPASPSPTPVPDDPATAGRGLLRTLAAHPRDRAHPVIGLAACPLGAVTRLAAAGLGAAGQHTAVPAGRTEISNWRVGADSGGTLACYAGGASTFAVGAQSHAHAVARTPIAGYAGPVAFHGGRLYQSVDGARHRNCGAYWTPASSAYVVSVQFVAAGRVTPAACGAALRAVQGPVVAGLSRLA